MPELINPLNSVPLNTKRIFVSALTGSGCRVFMPVDSDTVPVIKDKKKELSLWLTAQGK